MNLFTEEAQDIYRLKVPFDNLYTSVFLIRSGREFALVDTASSDYDVDEYIIPALKECQIPFKDIRYLVLSHSHSDHAGGLDRLLFHIPHLTVIREVRALWDEISTYPLAGHTRDAIGVFDGRTKTLITADGLQGAGVGKYRCHTESASEYIETIRRIQEDKRIENLLFAHAYEPWYRDSARGRKETEECLLDCLSCVKCF